MSVCASRGELLKKTDGLRRGGWEWGRWETVDGGKRWEGYRAAASVQRNKQLTLCSPQANESASLAKLPNKR